MEDKNNLICSIIVDDIESFKRELNKIKIELSFYKIDLEDNTLLHIIADNNRYEGEFVNGYK